MSALNDVQWQRWYCVFYQCWLNVSCHSSSTLSATLTFMELPQIQSDTNTVSQMQQNNHPQLGGSPPLSSSFKLVFLLIRSWEIYRKNEHRPKTGELTWNRHSSSFFFLMAGWCHGAMGLDSGFMGYTCISSAHMRAGTMSLFQSLLSIHATVIFQQPLNAMSRNIFDDCCQINQTLMLKNILKFVFNSLAF